MSSERIADQLSETPLFRDLSWQQLMSLSAYFTPRRVRVGETLFEEGSIGDALYLVVKGEMAIIKSGQQLAKMTAGRSFGEMALLDREPRSASARALADSDLLAMSAAQFQLLLSERASLATQFMLRLAKLLSQRLRYAGGELVDLIAHEVTPSDA